MEAYVETRGRLAEQFADAQRIKRIAIRHGLSGVSYRKRMEGNGMSASWRYNFYVRWDDDWYHYPDGLDIDVSGPDNATAKALIADIKKYARATWLKASNRGL